MRLFGSGCWHPQHWQLCGVWQVLQGVCCHWNGSWCPQQCLRFQSLGIMTRSGGGRSQCCAHTWLWGPVAGASVGEMMVADAHVVGRPRKAVKAKTNNGSLLKLMSTELVMLSNHLILCCPSPFPSVFSSIRVFPNESALCIRWPKYWSFSSSISLFNKISGLISFRIDWFDLPAVQRTVKSLLKYHSSKASILQGSAFFLVQLSFPYMTTGKSSSVLVVNSFRGKICCICLRSRSMWTVTAPAMWLLLVLWSSFLCLAISIRLAQLCRSAGSEPEAGFSYGVPKG